MSAAAACAGAARMFAYNASFCACAPGYYLSPNGTACASLPSTAGGGGALSDWQVGTVGAGSRNQTLYFLAPVLSLDAVRRHTQSQAVLLAVFDTQHWAAMERRSRGRGHGHGGRRRAGRRMRAVAARFFLN